MKYNSIGIESAALQQTNCCFFLFVILLRVLNVVKQSSFKCENYTQMDSQFNIQREQKHNIWIGISTTNGALN